MTKEERSRLAREAWKNPELRKRQSEKIKEAWKDPDLRFRQHISHVNKPRSEEAKQKTSATLKGRPFTKSHRENLMKGLRQPEVHKKRIAAIKEHHSSPEFKAKISAISKGIHKRPEVKKRVIALLEKGRETQRKQLQALPAEERQNHKRLLNFIVAGHAASAHITESSLERAIQQCLSEMKVPFQTHIRFHPYTVDIYIPKIKLVIECDGFYWHNLEAVKAKAPKRETFLKEKGLLIIHLLEKDIKHDPLQALLTGLQFFPASLFHQWRKLAKILKLFSPKSLPIQF